MKDIIRKMAGDQILGMIDFWRYPQWKNSWGGDLYGAFNGQKFRCQIFKELVNSFDFNTIFETGTFHGSTTKFMADLTHKPVFTVEGHERTFGYCRARFWNNSQIHLFYGDSRRFLKEHLSQKSQNIFIFVCLDAHWSEDLPLLEEIEIILDSQINAVVMIDDFQVINDEGYLFDDYGGDKKLTIDYLNPIKERVSIFFPNCPSLQESGPKKGCVVLGTSNSVTTRLQNMQTLIRL